MSSRPWRDAARAIRAAPGWTATRCRAGYESPPGELAMRKTDHRLQAPLYLGNWAKQGGKGAKYDAENTGYGFRSEAVWDAYVASQPTSCQMVRPAGA